MASACLVAGAAFAQASPGQDRLASISRLESRLKEVSDDSIKTRTLLDLSYEYQYLNHTKSLAYAEGGKLADKLRAVAAGKTVERLKAEAGVK